MKTPEEYRKEDDERYGIEFEDDTYREGYNRGYAAGTADTIKYLKQKKLKWYDNEFLKKEEIK